MSAAAQLALAFDAAREARERSLDAAFAEFHAANPHVYAALVRLARELVAAGHPRGSMKMLFEVVRWQTALRTTDPDWKLNNNWHSRMARLVMAQEPDLAGFFETRELRT